jgi:predicted AAA+ superfamily ATPase
MIGYFKPSRSEYHEIVKVLAQKHPEIKMTEDDLFAEANRWEMRHGGLSGRTAQQFINYLAGISFLR